MGLQVSNVSVKRKSGGDPLTSFWIKLESTLIEKPVPKVSLILEAYATEADLDAGFSPLRFQDTGAGLATDVPSFLRKIEDTLTPAQYATFDNTQVHNQTRQLLIEGDAHARWDELIGAEQVWAGFGTGNVVTDMPT